MIPVGGTTPTATTGPPADPDHHDPAPDDHAATLPITEARHRVGNEFRCRGTASAATVTVRTPTADHRRDGRAAASGASQVRLKPGPTAQVPNVLVSPARVARRGARVANG